MQSDEGAIRPFRFEFVTASYLGNCKKLAATLLNINNVAWLYFTSELPTSEHVLVRPIFLVYTLEFFVKFVLAFKVLQIAKIIPTDRD